MCIFQSKIDFSSYLLCQQSPEQLIITLRMFRFDIHQHTISCFSAVLPSYSCSGDIPRSLSLCSSISSSCCFSASLASRSLSLASHSLCHPAFSNYKYEPLIISFKTTSRLSDSKEEDNDHYAQGKCEQAPPKRYECAEAVEGT